MKKKFFWIVVLAIMLGACCWWFANHQQQEAAPTDELSWYYDLENLQGDLRDAIAAVLPLDSSKICHNLMPVRKGYPGEEWVNIDGRDMVLVVTLVDSSRLQKFFGRDDVYRIDREMGTWITIPNEWKSRRDAFEGLDSVAAHMRLIQMYGLSPDCDYDIMVQFYADPAGMFRPAHDPDITTTSAPLDFPAHVDENYKIGETNFREWYRYSVAAAYEDDSPLPWTQLGYTYDWHRDANHVGLSEYIVGHNTLIKVKKSESAWAFVRNLAKP